MRTSAVLIIAAALSGFSPVLAPAQVTPAVADYPDFREIVQDAKAKVFPAVVYIRCLRESNEGGKKESQQVSGSGVIISAGGEVVTNWHVIDKATDVRCLLSDGRHADAEILGSDKDTDLALLKLRLPDSESVPYADIGPSAGLKEGDFVMAMGAPWGLNRSVSIGIISCTFRYHDECSEYSHWLQTDASINPGNSGGPLVNTAGEIIGINSRGMSGFAEGMGFAIPSDIVSVLLPQLREHGRVNWAWTGLQLQPLHDFNRDMYFPFTDGVLVAETDPESPARHAGLRPRDRILRINGETLTALTTEDLPAVRRRIGLLPLEQDATFDIMRGEEAVTIALRPREKGKVEGEELALERLDFTVKAINQFDNPDLFFHRKQGVFVYGVKYPGNAANAGLSGKDILLKIDNKPVETIEDVKRIHGELTAQERMNRRVVVVVLRGGLMRQIVLDYTRDYSRE